MSGADESSPDTSPTLFDMAMYETATGQGRVGWPTPTGSDNDNRRTKPTPAELEGRHGWSLKGAIVAEATYRRSISSAAASPASPSATLAGDWVPPTNAGSGPSSCESYARLGPDGCWLRMYQDSFQSMMDGSLEECSGTWPRAGTMRNGTAYRRQPLVPRISAIGSSLWPTPVQDGDRTTDYAQGGHSLGAHVRRWPTPSVPSGGRSLPEGTTRTGMTPDGKKRQVDLGQAVKRWPTPTSRDWKGETGANARAKGHFQSYLPDAPTIQGGQLNADWVSLLMGFPEDWCVVDGNAECPER